MATSTGLSMTAADAKVLEQPLIADDITKLIGKVRRKSRVGEKMEIRWPLEHLHWVKSRMLAVMNTAADGNLAVSDHGLY